MSDKDGLVPSSSRRWNQKFLKLQSKTREKVSFVRVGSDVNDCGLRTRLRIADGLSLLVNPLYSYGEYVNRLRNNC